jgi:hypothetical protein
MSFMSKIWYAVTDICDMEIVLNALLGFIHTKAQNTERALRYIL